MTTASDASVREFRLFVPSDRVAALTEEEQHKTLELMQKNFDANTTPSDQLDLSELSI